ncbi:MAG: FAD:protein FMN transferase [Pedosphaera sp.]|nr:FAD:protein FMN transferase [Pedosphaera sp.]
MQTVALARNAMATRFEILLHGEDAVALRAAAEEALDEIERLEAQLSLYRLSSEISGINSRAARAPVRVEPELFRLLQQSRHLSQESDGAFDITIAPLVRCWGFMGGTGKMPEPQSIAEARSRVGMQLVTLNEDDFTIRFLREGVMIDLGSIGKGYALERAAEILRDAGVTCALLHGGTSTVYAIGAPPDADAWKVAIDVPDVRGSEYEMSVGSDKRDAKPVKPLAMVPLKNEALSVSGVHGKSFNLNGKMYGHVIDPRTGEPVQGALLAAVILPSATETDALSTALLTLGASGHQQIASLRPGMRTLLLTRKEGTEDRRLESKGILEAF